jgi:hypothetical protein
MLPTGGAGAAVLYGNDGAEMEVEDEVLQILEHL